MVLVAVPSPAWPTSSHKLFISAQAAPTQDNTSTHPIEIAAATMTQDHLASEIVFLNSINRLLESPTPMAERMDSTEGQQYHQRRNNNMAISAPTCFDVLNGRGQGVQRHAGNVKYRTLVFLNKGLYAKCPRSDKSKISKGIVAAVRQLGGRFLELDERSGLYHDIGDKKAWDKTSQALREGQKKIRQKMYREAAGSTATNETPQIISREGYFGYSVQLLESLYQTEERQPSPAIRPSVSLSPIPFECSNRASV